jgi:hypothetical protein
MPPCKTCLDLNRFTEQAKARWCVEIKDDLREEYALEFESPGLEVSAKSGCRICWIVRNGLELMSRKLFLLDTSQAYRGRFILQTDCPLEIEVSDSQQVDDEAQEPSQCARVQFYTVPGGSQSHICFLLEVELTFNFFGRKSGPIMVGFRHR